MSITAFAEPDQNITYIVVKHGVVLDTKTFNTTEFPYTKQAARTYFIAWLTDPDVHLYVKVGP